MFLRIKLTHISGFHTASEKRCYARRLNSIQTRLPVLLKDLVAFLAIQVHGIKKRKVPITDNY